jgi:hypothetical protein
MLGRSKKQQRILKVLFFSFLFFFFSSHVFLLQILIRRDILELDLDGPEISRENFPLPTLGGKLLALADAVHFGRGFFALRGLDPNDYSVEDNAIMFLGLSSYVGEQRAMQDNKGNMMGMLPTI